MTIEKTGKVLQDLSCGIELDSIDRPHGIGSVHVGDDGATRQKIILKFKSFAHHTKVYHNQRELKTIRVRLNLTRNRLVTLGREKHKPLHFVL